MVAGSTGSLKRTVGSTPGRTLAAPLAGTTSITRGPVTRISRSRSTRAPAAGIVAAALPVLAVARFSAVAVKVPGTAGRT